MVYCPLFLRNKKPYGVTVIELLVVVAFIGILAVVVASLLNPRVQIAKSRDARRKSDLQKLRTPLEDYHNDHECYPPRLSDLTPYYLKELPKDPETKQIYLYLESNCDRYWVYTNLENGGDKAVIDAGCLDGCGPAGRYNYGVASDNTRLEDSPTGTPIPITTGTPTPTSPVGTVTPTVGTNTPTPTPVPPVGNRWGCRSGVCVSLPANSCQPLYDVDYCYNQCTYGNECM